MTAPLKIIPLLLLFAALSCTHQDKQPNKALVIQKLLDSLYKTDIFNGAIVIAEDDSIIFSKGYGYANFKDSVPFTIHTISDGGSLAKTFTVAALRKLHAQRKINLQDPVQKYLPLYPYPATSVHDLIIHNAGGLPDYDFFFSKISDTTILTNELMLSLLNKLRPPLLDSARQGFNYENCGMDLAALIIEKITGQKYQEVLSEFFFQPLAMNSTAVRPALLSEMSIQRAMGYSWKNESLVAHDIVNREGFYGGSNLHFTASDLYKWGESFYQNNMNADIIKEGLQPAIVAGKHSGLNQLNWYYSSNKKAFYYWGNVFGFYSHLYHDDAKKFTIAFMTNTTLPYSLRAALATSLVEIMENGKYDNNHFLLPVRINLNDTINILGNYQTIKGDSIHIFQKGKQLHIQRNNELRYSMFIVDPITAYVPGIDAWISFTKESNKLLLHWNSVFLKETARKNYPGSP